MSEAAIRDRLESAVQPAFHKPFDPAADLARGRRRRRRNRAVGGTASCAALAAVTAVVIPALPFGPGGSGGVADGSPAVDTGGLSYVADGDGDGDGSIIHDGDREIDVSPHEIRSYAQVDDGFVFEAQDQTVYLTDGAEIERIGRAVPESGVVSDDAGSYVAWVAPSLETVVYDTARGVEVLRRPIGEGSAGLPPSVADIDGDVVYVRQNIGRDVGLAWDFGAQEPVRSSAALWDVSDGHLVRLYWPGASAFPTRVIVSTDPDADQPRFPALEGSGVKGYFDLSPSGRYIADVLDGRADVIERAAPQEDISPVVDGDYADFGVAYWIDDDRYVVQAYRWDPAQPRSRPSDLLVCSVSAGACELAAESVGEFVGFPD